MGLLKNLRERMGRGDLKMRTLTGIGWTFGVRASVKVLGLFKLIILAAFLSAADFGLLGISMLIIASVETITETGLSASLIHRRGDIEKYLDPVWTFLLVRGVLLGAVVFLIAPQAADFFGEPDAVDIIRAISLYSLMHGFTNIGVVKFDRDMRFDRFFYYQVAGTSTEFLISVAIVLIFPNVWALIIGILAGKAGMVIASYLISDYRPHFKIDMAKVRDLSGFGKWVFLSTLFTFLLIQGDDFFVGATIGAAALGLYQVAYRFSNAPATEIVQVIGRVTFPTYANLQHDEKALVRAYTGIYTAVTALIFFTGGTILSMSRSFTEVFFSSEWQAMIPIMMLLSIYGILRALGSLAGPMWTGTGRPQLGTYMQFFKLVLMIVLIVPLSDMYGLMGVTWAVVLSALPEAVLTIIIASRSLHIPYDRLPRLMVPGLSGMIVVSTILLALDSFVISHDIWTFIGLALADLCLFVAWFWASDMLSGGHLRGAVKEIMV